MPSVGTLKTLITLKVVDKGYQLCNFLARNCTVLWSEFNFLADFLQHIPEGWQNGLVDLYFFGEVAAKLELVGQLALRGLNFRHEADHVFGGRRRRILHENAIDSGASVGVSVLTRLLDRVRLDLHFLLAVATLDQVLQEQRINELCILVCHRASDPFASQHNTELCCVSFGQSARSLYLKCDKHYRTGSSRNQSQCHSGINLRYRR